MASRARQEPGSADDCLKRREKSADAESRAALLQAFSCA
jgi:hypothetical protein